MIFKSIRLKNFRQYKQEVLFDFSIPENNRNNITLLIAANGVGKTTLLQAFRYCFYGKSSNYLNLPKADELVNNTLIDQLKDLDKDTMFVEVRFNHNNKEYIARRESTFTKAKGFLKEYDREKFELSELTGDGKNGFKPFKEGEANDKIRSILPEGLSQVFMFDGERMERNISDKEFSSELKESILGILDIKKYDKLIEILGYPGRSTSVIGKLANKKKSSNEDDRKTREYYEKLLSAKTELEDQIADISSKIENINSKINVTQEQQKKIKENADKVDKKKQIYDSISEHEIEIERMSKDFISKSKNALVYKLLLENKKRYDTFISQGNKTENFYAYLHIDTIDDVENKGICICGRPIKEHTVEFDRLETLKKHALPIESSQHLNMIEQKFKQSAGYKEQIVMLNSLMQTINDKKNILQNERETVHLLSQEIAKAEKLLGLTNQLEIESLLKERDELIESKGSFNTKLKQAKDAIQKLDKKIQVLDKNSEYNQRINRVIELVTNLKSKLEAIKNTNDGNARNILAEKFNLLLSKTIQGKYDVTIDNKYQMKIVDLGNGKDVTSSLNTGHNVVISLTFISALIQTAKILSKKIDNSEKYGVIMDAALSNLDELHIEKLCKNTLNSMDQLVFLSFKRQLRDEMFSGIKDNIGKAYELKKHPEGDVYSNQLLNNDLYDYIHQKEENE